MEEDDLNFSGGIRRLGLRWSPSPRLRTQREAVSVLILWDFVKGALLKVRNHCWTGSVQGAVATWSVISMRYFETILESHS